MSIVTQHSQVTLGAERRGGRGGTTRGHCSNQQQWHRSDGHDALRGTAHVSVVRKPPMCSAWFDSQQGRCGTALSWTPFPVLIFNGGDRRSGTIESLDGGYIFFLAVTETLAQSWLPCFVVLIMTVIITLMFFFVASDRRLKKKRKKRR